MSQETDVMQISGDGMLQGPLVRQYYYATDVPWGNYETDEVPFFVNCADFTAIPRDSMTRVPYGRRDWSVCYVAEGEMIFSLNGAREERVCPGTVVVVPPGTQMVYGQKNQTVRRCYWLHFTGSEALSVMQTCGFADGGYFRLPDEYGATAAFTALLDAMRHDPTPLNRLRVAASAIALLTQLARAIERGNRKRRLPHSVSYLREHFTEEIDKTALAAMDGLGPSRYHEVFRRTMGCTPAGYITRLRMAKARQLLLDPDLPIGDVAEACGYSDPLYFSRVFRKECGVSPTEFRRHGLET